MECHKKLIPIVTELFLSEKNLNIYLKNQNLISNCHNGTNYFIMKIPNKRDFQRAASNHLSDIDLKDFKKLYKDYTKEPYLFLVRDATFSSDNTFQFRKNLLKK